VNAWRSGWIGACLLAAAPSLAGTGLDGAIARRCAPLGLLPEVVQGVIEVESGGQALAIGAQFRGAHRSYVPGDLAYARALLGMILRYTDNVGIGLMQVNWRAWGKTLKVSPEALFDPEVNLQVGCRILQQELLRHGAAVGVGAYHSPTPWRRDAYSRRVRRAIRQGGRR
jgi:hypothetical protein